MLGEAEGPTLIDPQRLERAAATHECLVVGVDDRLVGIDETAPRDGEREQRHARTGSGSDAPIACRSGRALTQDSSISSSGSESQTMPPPTQR